MNEWYEKSAAERERDDHAEQVAMESAYEMQRDDVARYVADPAEYVGLPAPDLRAVASRQGDAEPHGPNERITFDELLQRAAAEVEADADRDLVTRVADAIGAAQGATRRGAARHIIALVREHDRRASHEGATVSDLVAERLQGGER